MILALHFTRTSSYDPIWGRFFEGLNQNRASSVIEPQTSKDEAKDELNHWW